MTLFEGFPSGNPSPSRGISSCGVGGSSSKVMVGMDVFVLSFFFPLVFRGGFLAGFSGDGTSFVGSFFSSVDGAKSTCFSDGCGKGAGGGGGSLSATGLPFEFCERIANSCNPKGPASEARSRTNKTTSRARKAEEMMEIL